MPEIPEMEVYRQQLTEEVLYKKIVDIEVNRPASINIETEEFYDLINDQLIVYISRRAKHLLFTLGNGEYMVAHLMLGGRIYLAQPEEKVNSRGSVVFHFLDGKRLYFINLRLGWLHILSKEEMDKKFENLGIEPLGKYFTLERFSGMLAEKKGALKPLLTDQGFLAGIGNCYSDEILFNAGIKPSRKANDLKIGEISRLYSAIPLTLKEAIQNGGYMEKPFTKGDKLTGGHNNFLKVYDRVGEQCYQCPSKIEDTKISGKKTFYCPTCQN